MKRERGHLRQIMLGKAPPVFDGAFRQCSCLVSQERAERKREKILSHKRKAIALHNLLSIDNICQIHDLTLDGP